jgi:hypothetical protein
VHKRKNIDESTKRADYTIGHKNHLKDALGV